MSYATRGSGPASSVNVLQDSGQYFGDKERRLLKSQLPPGKARGKGKPTEKSQTRGPDYRTKPVANDMLKELLAAPGGLRQASDAAQYGKLVEMRQKQAMIDRSDQAMREFQRLTQRMTGRQREEARRGGPIPGVSPAVERVVQNAVSRQRQELREAGASLQGRPVQRDAAGRPIGVGGAANVNVTPLVADAAGGYGGPDVGRLIGIGRSMGRAGR